MGEVYRADDTELHRPVAIKVLPEALTGDAGRLARFVQEARAASALNHPHLVAIYEIGQGRASGAAEAVHFIAMELVQGETLRRLIDSRRADLKRTLEYLAQAADALAAAHAAGIVHRDLKPDNIMIAEGGYAKVLDFGLAKLRAEPPLAAAAANEPTVTRGPVGAGPQSTSPGVVMGTVGYMSPEQAQGLPVDHRSDVFSFGCVLYEAATGTRPFSASSAIDTLHQIIHGQPAPIAQVAPSSPLELQRIVRKCLAKSPDERYQSMKDLALDLRDLRREMDSGSTPSVMTGGAPPPAANRTGLRLAAAAVVLLVIVAGAAMWLTRDRAAGDTPADLSLERITASGIVIDAAITEDGKYIVYGEAQGGQQKLWLRQTRGGRAIQLASTDGGFWGVAFNRDGTTVYYGIKSTTDPGTLFAIPVLGGSARAILSGVESAVTFSPDGAKIAYYRIDSDGKGGSSLMIAGANGENPEPLVTRRPPEFFAPGFFVAPSWSPDGRWIAAAVRNSQTRDARLALFSVKDGGEQSFPQRYADATYTAWMPDGSGIVLAGRMPGTVVSGIGGQLWLQPYPAGEIRRITNDLSEYRTVSLTRDGKMLVSVASESNARLSLATLTGGEERRLPEDRFAGATGVAWAPDGRQIYYIKLVQQAPQLWTMGSDGSNARELVARVRPSGVAVSPDGRWLAFGADREAGPGVWRANADGSSQRLLTPDPDPRWIAIAPDGLSVYFTSSRDGSPSTYRVSSEGGKPVLVAPLLERAVPSPDGRQLAGVHRTQLDAPYTISVLDASDGRVLNAISDVSIATGTTSLSWLRDGKTLLFVLAERMNLWKQPALGGPREKLTNFPDLWVLRFAVSPDETTLLLCRGIIIRDGVLLTNFR